MNKLENKLRELKRNSQKALVTYLTAGYPDIKQTVNLAELFEKNGADILEIGIPFSDPIADGKTIQFASQAALKKGINLRKALNIVKMIRRRSSIPIVLMGYMNPFMRDGIARTIRKAKDCGVDGLIIPDIIPEQSGEIRALCRKQGLSLIYLAAPNTPQERLKFIDKASTGFVYIVSIAGVTGARKQLPSSTVEYLLSTKRTIKNNPRIMGFGISNAKQVKGLKKHVDGVIVASALIEIMRKNPDKTTSYRRLGTLIRSLKKVLEN